MNYKIAAAWCAMMLCSSAAMASSPIPTFDKEAVTVHPYQRTGQQEKTLDMQGIDDSKLGNTGTAEHPTFYVQKIIIDSTTPPLMRQTATEHCSIFWIRTATAAFQSKNCLH